MDALDSSLIIKSTHQQRWEKIVILWMSFNLFPTVINIVLLVYWALRGELYMVCVYLILINWTLWRFLKYARMLLLYRRT